MDEREQRSFPLKEVCPAVIGAVLPGWKVSKGISDLVGKKKVWIFESPVFEAITKQREGIIMVLELRPDEDKLDLELRVDWDLRFRVKDLPVNGIFLDESEVAIYNEDLADPSCVDNKRVVIEFNPQNPTAVRFNMGNNMSDRASLYFAPLGNLRNQEVCLAPFGVPYKYRDGRLHRGPR